MGQRSQIYVRANGKLIIARYIRDKNKQHVENYRKLYVNTCFRNYDGSFRDIHMEVEVKNKDYDYTKDGIVKALNLLSDKKYDKVIIVDNMPDLSCGNPRITDEDRNYLYNLMGVTEEELTEKSMRTHRRWVVENMVAYKKINDGKTIEIYYQTPCGYDAIRFDVETKEFERRLVA